MSHISIYPGSFDPVTYGHIDIIQRASKLCDKLIVGVLKNSEKSPLFSVDERVKMLHVVLEEQGIKNVDVVGFEGLLVDFVRQNNARSVIRGLRAVTDFEYELQLSQLNKVLLPEMETLFLTTNLKYSYLSSSTTKEIASYGGDISEFVTPYVAEMVMQKYKEKKLS